MVNYYLATEEQIELADNVRKILEKELAPRLSEFENADGGLGKYPMDVQKILAQVGYCGMGIPEEWGGLGLDIVTQAVIIEEMAKVDAGFAFAFFNGNSYFPQILQTGMSHEEKQAWADKILAGDSLGCFSLTEPNAGSDAAAMRTSAVFDESTREWVINGVKCFASNGPAADHYIIFAWTDKTKSVGKGVTAFFVERKHGLQIGKKENKLGLHLSETSELVLEDVRVPETNVIGEVGKGFTTAMGLISTEGRTMGSCCCLGLAQAALDYAVEYAKTRRQFGKRIIDHQGVGFMIADMQARTEASRSLLYGTLEAMKQGKSTGYMGSLAKFYVSDNTMQTALDAVQVLGGYGYMKEYPVEKLMRDAKIFQIFSGTNQIQRKNVAKAIAGRDPMKAKK
jgi:alkylation response protein AidB-like acyl-CoA dehydrogenase